MAKKRKRNTPDQCAIIFKDVKIVIFSTFTENIDCRYMLETHQRDGSNEYP